MTQKIGISLGWNCSSAIYGVQNNIREKKENGYKTCPFDEMISNYKGMIQCIEDDFVYFTDPQYLEVKQIPPGLPYIDYNDYCNEIIVNTKYNFVFNHESPGHPFLPTTQNWQHGKYHYCIENYKYFIERYKRRIEKFRSYLNDPNNIITFILSRYNTTQNDISELHNVVQKKYPTVEYSVIILDTDKKLAYNNHLLMNVSETDDEVKRLSQ